MSARVRGVLFDLDDTLFDHNYATFCATTALRATEPLFGAWTPEELRRRHSEMLELIHREVVAGRMAIDEARRERFRRLLSDAGGDAAAQGRAVALATCYRREYERGWRPVAGAIELLTALRSRGLRIAIVTNNLTSEQQTKLRCCGLDGHVDVLTTSEAVGTPKPAPAIYECALEALGIAAEESVMVGDAWDTDIAGALAARVRPVWFNWRGLPARDTTVDELASLQPTARALQVIAGTDSGPAQDSGRTRDSGRAQHSGPGSRDS
jgi:HAD superfamily hydrolase (TIGR01509 family)